MTYKYNGVWLGLLAGGLIAMWTSNPIAGIVVAVIASIIAVNVWGSLETQAIKGADKIVNDVAVSLSGEEKYDFRTEYHFKTNVSREDIKTLFHRSINQKKPLMERQFGDKSGVTAEDENRIEYTNGDFRYTLFVAEIRFTDYGATLKFLSFTPISDVYMATSEREASKFIAKIIAVFQTADANCEITVNNVSDATSEILGGTNSSLLIEEGLKCKNTCPVNKYNGCCYGGCPHVENCTSRCKLAPHTCGDVILEG
jgi:hypothetical protein